MGIAQYLHEAVPSKRAMIGKESQDFREGNTRKVTEQRQAVLEAQSKIIGLHVDTLLLADAKAVALEEHRTLQAAHLE